MKINAFKTGAQSFWLPPKILLIMKLTTFILIVSLMQLSAKGFSQKISLNGKGMLVPAVLESIKAQSGFVFLYNSKNLNELKIDVKLKNTDITTALNQIFKDLPFSYSIENKNVFIKEKEKSVVNKVMDYFSDADFKADITVTGRVSDEGGKPIPGASVTIKGTNKIVSTDANGKFTLSAGLNSTLVIRFVGFESQEIRVTGTAPLNIVLKAAYNPLNEVVVTALGIKQEKRALGYAITEIKGQEIAQTQRENFLNSLQGRVAGLTVAHTSGLPGASASVVIRGISSLSGSNQPLFIVDGLPIDNKTFSTGDLASDIPGSATLLSDKGVDFSNRAADINPEDIESITVLKGPEASALYGIDAASGAIVITTKKGVAGTGKINYGNSFKVVKLIKTPEIQTVYGPGTDGISNPDLLSYFGPKYPEGTKFYDNIGTFFQNSLTNRHYLSFEGGVNKKITYRLTGTYLNENGIVPSTALTRLNLGGTTSANITKYLSANITFGYTSQKNDQVYKGSGGVLLGLLTWPSADNAKEYLNPDGTRRTIQEDVTLTNEVENPYFNFEKNVNHTATSRVNTNVELAFDPVKWFSTQGQLGIDNYTNEILLVRHPQSNLGFSKGGVLDVATAVNKNLNAQLLNTVKQDFGRFKTSFLLGGSLNQFSFVTNAVNGEGFLDPDFYSINNTDPTKHRGRTVLRERRLLGVFGNMTVNYNNIVYVTGSFRNDWTSTLPLKNRSFFSPSAQMSFVFSELNPFKTLTWLTYGKLRFSGGSVGKDAPPYGTNPGLENQRTTGGGFSYGFTAPSPDLKAERTRSMEAGAELKFLHSRLGVDLAVYRKKSIDQIIKDLRLSYGTGYILQVFNGGDVINEGIELQLDATPVKTKHFTWDILANFNATRSEVGILPQGLEEYYNSDVMQYLNVRNGVKPGYPATTFTTPLYKRNNQGELLISPVTGLPLRNSAIWEVAGDRNPDFTIGLTNRFIYKNFSLNFLIDFRKGGDIFNATEHFLTSRGLSKHTLNREQPVVIKGVFYDGMENTAKPNYNNIIVTPYYNSTNFYSVNGAINEEDFIEKNIGWIRMRDITLSYKFDQKFLKRTGVFKNASIFFTATDLFLITNYTGLDPAVSGSSAAVGGSGAVGFDYGTFPMPMGLNFGIQVGL
ncbi:SusC/RagA family TonB-linked outer membrane protein [Pedobacter nyackensis]|nr:SusC/RagA family TonB-linked outer membrane protein [Pedobacter nyackensis]